MFIRAVALASRILIGGMPFAVMSANAQVLAPAKDQTDPDKKNDDALRTWQQQSGATAALKVAPDGSTKIEFHGNISADVYRNTIETPTGASAAFSPMQSGTFFKTVVQGDYRATSEKGGIAYVQGTITNSNDRSILSRYQNQLSNFQIGYVGQDHQLMAGDVAVNYSQLSTAMGFRGFSGSKKIGSLTVSGHAGVIAESWEALANKRPLDDQPTRSRFLRNVLGVKLENAFTENFKVYATAQSYDDKEGSVPIDSVTLLPAQSRSTTAGFIYQEGNFSVTGETAVSRYQEKDQDVRPGHATIIDGAYRFEAVALRAGFHNVSSSFASSSQAVPPGVREAYIGADWTAASWLTLGTDYRNSKVTTPSYQLVSPPTVPPLPNPPPVIGTTTATESLASRVNINFGPDFPGWSLALQDTHSRGIDATGLDTFSSNYLSSLTYSSQTWTSMISIGAGRVNNDSTPQYDSKTETWQFQLGRQFSNANADIPASWNANVSFTAGRQLQKLINSGTSTQTINYGLIFSAQRVKSLQFNGSITEGTTTQPGGGPDLKTRMVQLDATYPFGWTSESDSKIPGAIKLYARKNLRNMGDLNLRTLEDTIGIQLTYAW